MKTREAGGAGVSGEDLMLGDGVRLYDNRGGEPVRLHRIGDDDPRSAVNVRYRPVKPKG